MDFHPKNVARLGEAVLGAKSAATYRAWAIEANANPGGLYLGSVSALTSRAILSDSFFSLYAIERYSNKTGSVRINNFSGTSVWHNLGVICDR